MENINIKIDDYINEPLSEQEISDFNDRIKSAIEYQKKINKNTLIGLVLNITFFASIITYNTMYLDVALKDASMFLFITTFIPLPVFIYILAYWSTGSHNAMKKYNIKMKVNDKTFYEYFGEGNSNCLELLMAQTDINESNIKDEKSIKLMNSIKDKNRKPLVFEKKLIKEYETEHFYKEISQL